VRVGLYGGTYDPIHVGHLIIAEYVREELNLARILFIPSGDPPHKSCPTPPEVRAAMVQAAIQGNRYFEFCDIELQRRGPSYSVDTIAEIRERYGLSRDETFWMIGADSLVDIHLWHEPERIFELATVVVFPRVGVRVEDAREPFQSRALVLSRAPLLDISSTDIRCRVQAGKSIRYLVPESVEELIRANRLYL
jgi:nicotinate-nucleotide adenylyltransferase